MTISFKVTSEEHETIEKIVARAERDGLSTVADRAHLTMDVTATHASGCPLDLAGLLDADEFNFAHDVLGIVRHLDRNTGQLGDCFLPRYSKRED